MRIQGISFFVALSFALYTVANPIISLPDRGIKIDLSRRGSLTKADGTFDYERFRASAIRTIKYVLDFCLYMLSLLILYNFRLSIASINATRSAAMAILVMELQALGRSLVHHQGLPCIISTRCL